MDNIDYNKDYYSILGVEKTATKDDIHRAYLKKSKSSHPDLHPDDKDATKKFQEIQEANEVLSDEGKRSQYDSVRNGGGNRFNRFSNFGFHGGDPFMNGEADPFAEFRNMYEGGFRNFHKQRIDRTPRSGRNIRINVSLPFEDFFFGCSKTLDIKVSAKCKYCKNGLDGEKEIIEKCPYCNGNGVRISQHGNMIMQETCQACAGSGSIISNKCKHCNGTSVDGERTQTIIFEIPRCTSEDYTKTYSKQGNCGIFGGENGDITISASMGDNGKFFRRGYDTIATVHYISIFKAMTGGKELVLTPYGEREIDIPSGIDDGFEMKIDGFGIKKRNSMSNGDLIVILKYDIPKDISGQEMNALRKVMEKFEKKTSLFKNKSMENEYVKEYLLKLKENFGH